VRSIPDAGVRERIRKDVLTGRLVDRHGWRTAVMSWAACALVAAAASAALWNQSARPAPLPDPLPAPQPETVL